MGDHIIGRGERTAVKILKETFPAALIYTQVPILHMVTKEIFDMYSEPYQNATIDILMVHHNKRHAIRVQDKSHTTKYKSQKDNNQRGDMEDNDIIVIDIHEREAPYLFREILDYRSKIEVLLPLKTAKVKP